MKQENEQQLIYGTGNPAKVQAMKRWLCGLPVTLTDLNEAAAKFDVILPRVEEIGKTPLENARVKSSAYYECFQRPVFSCDSGLYLWNYETGEMLPEELQPGIFVRGREKRRYTDEELILHYIDLVKRYGPLKARYQNVISLILPGGQCFESTDESLWGDFFLLTDTPHSKKISGFPLDSISIQIKSGKYYYDLEGNIQDDVAAGDGFRHFFEKVINTAFWRDE